MNKILAFLRRFPFTLLMLFTLGMVGVITNTYVERITHHWLNRFGFAPADLWLGRLERIFTSALVTSGGFVFWEGLFFVAFAVGSAEWMTGSKRAAATFWGVHFLSLILLSGIVTWTAHQLPDIGMETVIIARDVGPSAGYFACLGLASASLKRPWRWVSGGILLIIFVVALFLPPGSGETAEVKFLADLAHLLAFPLGWLSGRIAPGTLVKPLRRKSASPG